MFQKFSGKGDLHLREIAKGSSSALVMRVFGGFSAYVFALLISRQYGAAGLGLYSLSVTLLTVLATLAGLGMGASAVRLIPQYVADNNLRGIRGFYILTVKLAVPIAVAVGALLYVSAPFIAQSVFRNPSLATAFRVVSLVLPAFAVVRINTEIVRGFKNIGLSEYLRSLHVPLIGACILIVLCSCGGGIYAAVTSYSLSIAIAFLVSTLYMVAKLRSLPVGNGTTLHARELLGVSMPMMSGEIMSLSAGRVDMLMIGFLASTRAVGLYDIPFRLAAGVGLILASINMISAPKFSELFWSKDMDGLRRVVRMTSRVLFWSSVPILVALLAAPAFWLGLFGEEFRGGYLVLVLLAVGQFVNAAAGSVGCILNMTGNHKILSHITLSAIVLNILLNALLIPRFGIIGAAIASTTALILWNIAAAVCVWMKFRIKTFYVPLLAS